MFYTPQGCGLTKEVIAIGGTRRAVVLYDEIMRMEPYDPKTGIGINPERYFDILFHNLGYNKKPETYQWLQEYTPIENIPKSIPIDIDNIPLKHPFLIVRDGMSLFDLLQCIAWWGRGYTEFGYIIDMKKSFKLPALDKLRHELENGYNVKRSCVLADKQYWSSSNILMRRLHNLCGHINPQYFCNCIRDFDTYAALIKVKHATAVFVSAIMNPDLLMTVIRTSEMKAAKHMNSKYGNYTALREDENVAIEFKSIFDEQVEKIHNVFVKHGAKGFIDYVVEEVKNPAKHTVVYLEPTAELVPDPLAELHTVEDKQKYVDSIELDSQNLADIFTYLDESSIPEHLTQLCRFRDNNNNIITQYVDDYYALLRRVYCLFEQFKSHHPHYLDPKNKWNISKSFYYAPNKFALYSKLHAVYIIAYPDITYEVADPNGAVKIYQKRYGDVILLDAEELGESNLESQEPKTTILKDSIPAGSEGKYVQATSKDDQLLQIPVENSDTYPKVEKIHSTVTKIQ